MSKPVGDAVEQAALDYLQAQGAHLVARNYRGRGGEIDLIVEHRGSLVFVEVRYRTHHGWGSAAESVDWRKQQRLTRTAQQFLQAHPDHQRRPCRFDVLACQAGQSGPEIEWIINAFEP